MTDWAGWLARNGAQLGSGDPPRLTYAFTQGQTVVVRRPQVTDGVALPALVSPNVAGSAPVGSTITLTFQDSAAAGADRRGREPVSGLGGRGPGLRGRRREPPRDRPRRGRARHRDAGRALALGPERRRPGRAGAAPPALRRARRSPPGEDLQSQLASEPLARGITLTLSAAAGLIAVLLAAVGFWLTLRQRRARRARRALRPRGAGRAARDASQPAARALARPRRLRRDRRRRARPDPLAPRRLGRSASRPRRPSPTRRCATTPAGRPALVGLAVLVAVVLVLIELTARHALRGATPQRASWSLE